jgi:hypothetical protein
VKRKKPGNQLNPWKARQQAIESADGLMAKAQVLGTTEAANPKQAHAARMQAALFFEAAARAYCRGSLGLAAHQTWALAKDCYLKLDHKAAVARCDRELVAVPTYWDGGEPPSADCP